MFTIPSLLHACAESRSEALKWYSPAFEVRIGHPVYFDWEQDILMFSTNPNNKDFLRDNGGTRALRAFTWNYNSRSGKGDRELSEIHNKLRKMVIGGWSTSIYHLPWIENFCNLKILVIPDTIGSRFNNRADVCLVQKTVSQRLKQEWARRTEERRIVSGDGDQRLRLGGNLPTGHPRPLHWEVYGTPVGDLHREDPVTEYSWPTKVVFIDGGTIEAQIGGYQTPDWPRSVSPTNRSSTFLELMDHSEGI